MSGQIMAKRERVVEAVRLGLEGDAALEFIHQSGFAMNPAGIARHLRSMGGRGRVADYVAEGRTNREILELCFPGEPPENVLEPEPRQGELFDEKPRTPPPPLNLYHEEQFETTKLAVRVPRELYTAIRLAARAEGKPQNQLIVDILTHALARMPRWDGEQGGEEPEA